MIAFGELRALQDLGAPERRRWRVGTDALRVELAQIEATAAAATQMRLCAIDLPESTELAIRIGVSCATPEFLGVARRMHGTGQLGFWRSGRATELVGMARAKFAHDVQWLEALAGDGQSLSQTNKPNMRARFGGRLVPLSDIPPRLALAVTPGGRHEGQGDEGQGDEGRGDEGRGACAGDAFVIATGIRALRRMARVRPPTPQEARLLLLRADARLRGAGAFAEVQAVVRGASSVDGWVGGEVRDWFVGAMDSLCTPGMTREQLLLQAFSQVRSTVVPVAGGDPVDAVMLVGNAGAVPFLLAEKAVPEALLYCSKETASPFRLVSTKCVVGTRALYEAHGHMPEDVRTGDGDAARRGLQSTSDDRAQPNSDLHTGVGPRPGARASMRWAHRERDRARVSQLTMQVWGAER